MAWAVLCGGLAGCAAPGGTAAGGGVNFVEMPLNQAGLVGATPQYLDAAFGRPVILRVEGNAQVWLYQNAGCGLNLVLYPDNAGTPRVAMAAPTGQGEDSAACSAVLARGHLAGAPLPVAGRGAAAPAGPPVPAPDAAPSAAGASLDGPGSAL